MPAVCTFTQRAMALEVQRQTYMQHKGRHASLPRHAILHQIHSNPEPLPYTKPQNLIPNLKP
jgi:hypothetical protein